MYGDGVGCGPCGTGIMRRATSYWHTGGVQVYGIFIPQRFVRREVVETLKKTLARGKIL